MPRKAPWPPPIYPRGGKDYVRLRVAPGKYHERCLGPTGSPEAKREYSRILQEVEAVGVQAALLKEGIFLAELLEAYATDQKPLHDRRGLHRIEAALSPAIELYGHLPARDFGPNALRAVREVWVAHPYCRRLCNQMAGIIRHAFRWAAAREMIPADVVTALGMLEPLRKKRTTAVDHPEIEPVELEVVEATLPHLLPTTADMVRLQMLTGMRPGEVCRLTPCDIQRPWKIVDNTVIWLYALGEHKTEWRGHRRWIPLGPRAQALLTPYLERRPDEEPVFSPREAVWTMLEETGRTVRSSYKRMPGLAYTTQSYDRAVRKACARARVSPWTPNQIRHTVGTLVETEYGREDARCMLGHSTPTTTAIYAEGVERAARIAAKAG